MMNKKIFIRFNVRDGGTPCEATYLKASKIIHVKQGQESITFHSDDAEDLSKWLEAVAKESQ